MKSEDNPDGTDLINKEVVSILSPNNKAKQNKHMTFAIPNSYTTNNETPSIISSKYNETVCNADIDTVLSVSTASSTTSNGSTFGATVSFSVPTTSINFSSGITFGKSSLQTNVSNSPAFPMVSAAGADGNLPSASRTTGNQFMFGSISPSTTKVNTSSFTTTTNSTNIISGSVVDRSEYSANKNIAL